MKTDFLVLPFYDDLRKTSLYNKAFYNSAPNVHFRVYCPYNEFLPFKAPLQSLDCEFTIFVRDYYNDTVAEIQSTNIKHKIFKKGNEKFIIFEGGIVNCLDLGSCVLPYYIQINNWFSEWFWVGGTEDMVRFEIGNNQDLLTVPYSLDFKQYFWINTKFGTSEIDTFKTTTRDERGNTKTKFQKLTENFSFYFFGVPAYMKQVFSSFESLDTVKVFDSEQEVISLEKQTTIKTKRSDDNFAIYEVELTIPSDKQNTLSYCEDSIYQIEPNCEGVLVPSQECLVNEILETEVDCLELQVPKAIELEYDFYAIITYQ